MNKPMSEQMQKLADRYEKAMGKKFGMKTRADKIRAMNDEDMATFLEEGADFCHTGMCKDGETCYICCLNWLRQPAEEDDHD